MKYAGAALLVLTFVFIGILLERDRRSKISQLTALSAFIAHIGDEISISALPLHDIYRRYSAFAGAPFFFSDALCAASGDIDAALCVCGEIMRLSNAEKSELRHFFASLGRGFREPQAELCREYSSRLAEAAAHEREELSRKIPVYRSLWLVLGLMVAILLI